MGMKKDKRLLLLTDISIFFIFFRYFLDSVTSSYVFNRWSHCFPISYPVVSVCRRFCEICKIFTFFYFGHINIYLTSVIVHYCLEQ